LPFTYTGADFYALCTDAMLKAVTRQAAAVDARIEALNSGILHSRQKHQHDQEHLHGYGLREEQRPLITTATFFDRYAAPDDLAVLVTEQDFIAAHQELVPSVSAGELAHYERVRAAFEGAGRAEQNGKGLDRGKVDSKGKGKAVVAVARGWKGKEVAVGNSGDDEDGDNADDDEDGLPEANTRRRDRGEGKAVAAFHDGASDDDGLYES
jgi:peroxin-6